jgi:hypothetical protein
MSEAYDYLKERVKELQQRITRQDEIIAWDADKLVECTTKIVDKTKRITELEVLRDSLATIIALLVHLPDGESGALYQLVERCYYWYGVDSNVPVTLGDISKPVCGECHLKPGEICDVCGAMAAGYLEEPAP